MTSSEEYLQVKARLTTTELEVAVLENHLARLGEELDNVPEEEADERTPDLAVQLWKGQKHLMALRKDLSRQKMEHDDLALKYEAFVHRPLRHEELKGRFDTSLQHDLRRQEQMHYRSPPQPVFQSREHPECLPPVGQQPVGRKYRMKLAAFSGKGDLYVFLQRFADHVRENDIRTASLDILLGNHISDDDTFRLLKEVPFTRAEQGDLDLFIAAVKRGLNPEVDRKLNLAKLGEVKQAADENVDKFYFRLQDAVNRAYESGAEGTKATEVFFLQGLRSEIRNEVLKFENPRGLKELKDLARKMEKLSVQSSGPHSSDLAMDPTSIYALQASQSRNPVTPAALATAPARLPAPVPASCTKCGRAGHSEGSCWQGIQCQICNGTGHTANVCYQRWEGSSNDRGSTNPRETYRRVDRGGYPNRAPPGRSCFTCGQESHIQRDCPERRQRDRYTPNRQQGGGVRTPEQREHLNGLGGNRNSIRSPRHGSRE